MEWYEKIYGLNFARLRYFNACGARPDGTIGEDHKPETHIIPVAIEAIIKGQPFFVFGKDYQTSDGTCVRDYIHVSDLADAHLKAAENIIQNNASLTVNLGVGKGYSNMEILQAVEKISGKKLDIQYKERRWGDPDAIYADNTKAKSLLGWEPKYTTPEAIIETAWKWHEKHPNGFNTTQ